MILLVLGAALTLCIPLLGASWYDIRLTWDKQRYTKHPGVRRFRMRPFISVVITSCLDIETTRQTLESILKSKYRQYEIIVCTTDKNFRKALPRSKRIHYLDEKNVTQVGRGELVLELAAGMTVEKQALTQAVWHFNNRPALTQLVLASRPRFSPRISHFFATYLFFARQLFMKTAASYMAINKTDVTVWRRAHNQPYAIGYADDSTILYSASGFYSMLSKNQHRTKKGSGLIRIYAIMLFLLSASACFIAAFYSQPTPLLVCILAYLLFTGAVIWFNTHLHFMAKVGYSATLPAVLWYFFYLGFCELLKAFTNMAKAIIPGRIGFFAGIEYIFRIVK